MVFSVQIIDAICNISIHIFIIIKICFNAYFYFEVFHTRCINEWLLRRNTCPICRDQIGDGDGGESGDDSDNDEQEFVGTNIFTLLSLRVILFSPGK